MNEWKLTGSFFQFWGKLFLSCSQFCSKCSFCQCFSSYTMFAALVFYLSEQLLDDQTIFTCCALLFQGSPPPLRPPWQRRHSGGNHLWCLSPWPRSSSCSSPRSSSPPPSPHLWASRRWDSALLPQPTWSCGRWQIIDTHWPVVTVESETGI